MDSPIATLYVEELKATMRGRFAWLGAAVILLAAGGLATVAVQGAWLFGYGVIAYGLVPLAFVPVAAGMIASPRVNRFVECVFTAPVNRRDWLAAKFLVLLTLATAYYVALLPMMLVYASHVGIPPLLHKYLLWTPGLLLAYLAVGTLIGVMFIGRSLAAPVGAAMGVLLAYAVLIPVQEVMVNQGNGATRTGHLALTSPAVMLKNALGFALATTPTSRIPTTTAHTWISFAVVVAGALILAAWVFLSAQGVETWETNRRQRWTIALALLGMGLLPVTFADTNYDTVAPAANNAPGGRGMFGRGEMLATLVAPGGRLPRRCCSPMMTWESGPLSTDRSNQRDLLLLLPVDSSASIANLHLQVAGDDGLEIVDPKALGQDAPQLEPHHYPGDSGPTAPDGHHVSDGWIARVPITLDPTHPWDIGGDRYPLAIAATYDVAGESHPRTTNARGAIEAQVHGSVEEMALAGGLFPLLCLGAGFARWRRTR
jgi:ABC-type transport system involved in multi-copper enzyme maturation permease subunit